MRNKALPIILAAIYQLFLIAPVHAQNPDPAPHERYHQYYQHWMQPNGSGVGCCNANEYYDKEHTFHLSGDCEPVRAEVRNGHWWAKMPEYLVKMGYDAWIEIPEDKVLRERNPSTEEGHLCFGTQVLCFVPPDIGG